jgi:hypothetical protein
MTLPFRSNADTRLLSRTEAKKVNGTVNGPGLYGPMRDATGRYDGPEKCL